MWEVEMVKKGGEPMATNRNPRSDGAERRVHPRKRMLVDVNLQSENNFFSAKTRDISTGGLFIETSADLPVGANIVVDLHLLKARLQLRAEVVWTLVGDDGGSVGIGVRFLDVPDAARLRIQAFMGIRDAMSIGEGEVDEG